MAIRGIEFQSEQSSQQLLRDTRTVAQKVLDFFQDPVACSVSLISLAVASLVFPVALDLFFFSSLILLSICLFSKKHLPFRVPKSSNMIDYNDPTPGSDQPQKGRGIYFFGNEKESAQELWFNNDDMRTHVLIFGSTGSGKTEALISLGYNALLQGSGLIYVDGKGDNSLFAKIFSMARAVGREDDVLLVNFMTAARDIIGPQKTRLSNTLNPFSTGSSSMLSQLVISLMDSSSQSSDGDMWKGRAISFVEALMKILVYMRDRGHILLDAHTIRNYFLLPKLEMIVIDRMFPISADYAVSLEDAPEVVLQPIDNYVLNLPGFDRNRRGKQGSEVFEQHGFITMQLTRAFGSLADTYGHILRTNLAEVDFRDVVLNRRILIVLLPALEKSPEELANLGKIIVASLKAMMAAGLGDEVEGSYKEVIQRKPTSSPTPFLCILDEYGYYAVKGFAVVPAQARSLGFSAVFAGQDLPAFQKVSKEEAASIGANTNIKIAMKLEDPTETWEFFQKTAGEAYVTQTSGFQLPSSTLSNTYADAREAKVEKRARIDLLDLKDQREGEAHIFFKSKIVRAKLFYANPTPVARMKVNQMVKVAPPSDPDLVRIAEQLNQFSQGFMNPNTLNEWLPPEHPELLQIQTILSSKAELIGQDKALATLAVYFHEEEETADDIEKLLFSTQVPANKLTIFNSPKIKKSDFLMDFMRSSSQNTNAPILDKQGVFDDLVRIESLLGQGKQMAHQNVSDLIQTLEKLTLYPTLTPPDPLPIDVANSVDRIIEHYNNLTNNTEV